MTVLFWVTGCWCHLLYSHPHIGFVAGSDLIGCSMRLQTLVPFMSDTPSFIRWRTRSVNKAWHSLPTASGRQRTMEGVSDGCGYSPTEPRSDWLPPEKLQFSQLLNARDGADGTDGPTMHFGIAPCKVNEIRQRTDAVGKGCNRKRKGSCLCLVVIFSLGSPYQ